MRLLQRLLLQPVSIAMWLARDRAYTPALHARARVSALPLLSMPPYHERAPQALHMTRVRQDCLSCILYCVAFSNVVPSVVWL